MSKVIVSIEQNGKVYYWQGASCWSEDRSKALVTSEGHGRNKSNRIIESGLSKTATMQYINN